MKYQITVTYRMRYTTVSEWTSGHETHIHRQVSMHHGWDQLLTEFLRKARASAGHPAQVEIECITFTPLETLKA